MKSRVFCLVSALFLVVSGNVSIASAQAAVAAPAQAAPQQLVLLVADGASPQFLELGRDYLRVADDAPEMTTAFDSLGTAHPLTGAGSTLTGAKLLETAAKNGFKTGLVTTGDIMTEAPSFRRFAADFPSGAAGVLNGASPNFDFIAGGGRAQLGAEIGETLRARGDTYLDSVAGLDGEIGGRVVAPQADLDLDFAIDRDPNQQAGLGELVNLALDTLGKNDAPFVLVIHDTLIKKALETRDTPALLGEFRELNALLSEVLARRAEHPDLQLAVWLTGSPITPRFTTPIRAEQQSALRALSNFSLSYAGAGRALQGAGDAAIDDFTDALDGQYPGLQFAPTIREQLLAGTLDGRDAVRAASEPLVKIGYDGPAAPLGFSLGAAPGDFWEALQSAVTAPAR